MRREPALVQKAIDHRCQRGLSLVEIMVAMTLGLILLAGVIQLFVSNKRAFEVQTATNGMQENGRYAMKLVTDSLRAADHWGGVGASEVGGMAAVSGVGSCDAAWILNYQEGIRGYEGVSATPPLPSGCIDAADYVPNSDAFVVRHGGGEYQATAVVKAGNGSDVWLRTAVGRRARVFSVAAITSLPGDLYDAGNEDAVGIYNYPYQVSAYFVRPCSGKLGAACSASDDGGRPLPTLTRLTLLNGGLQEQAMVSGIEQMQVEYGVDADLDNNTDFYADAATITAAGQWNRVASARVTLIVRSDERGPIADTTSYNLPDGTTYTVPTDAQMYQRKLFTSVVQIRNRSRS
jgi:prepilin-type N-terminal cleavage/methylation domain-containing protein